jgi:hypothetical protein
MVSQADNLRELPNRVCEDDLDSPLSSSQPLG